MTSSKASLFFLFWVVNVAACLRGEIVSWQQPLPKDLTKAELYSESSLPAVNGVLVLCPGMNGDGKKLVAEEPWRAFAKERGLGLVGVSFSSPPDLLYGHPARGYYYPDQGSGDVLLGGLRKIYGRDVKIFIYGFSGGAQFTSRFVEQHPAVVLSWAAYSASFWGQPMTAGPTSAPGIVACGEFDSGRYGPSFGYFQQGRRKDARWTWVSLGLTGHIRHRRLEEFIRAYFYAIMDRAGVNSSWFDAETKQPVGDDARLLNPALSVWLPSPVVAEVWLKLHHP